MPTINDVRIKWNGDELLRKVGKALRKRLEAIGPKLVAKVQENISIPTAEDGPSKPGEFPHEVSGAMKESVYWAIADYSDGGCELGVGVNAISKDGFDYGLHHEYVTGRSFLRRTLYEEWPELSRELTAPLDL